MNFILRFETAERPDMYFDRIEPRGASYTWKKYIYINQEVTKGFLYQYKATVTVLQFCNFFPYRIPTLCTQYSSVFDLLLPCSLTVMTSSLSSVITTQSDVDKKMQDISNNKLQTTYDKYIRLFTYQ